MVMTDIVERLRYLRCETNECWRERCAAGDEIEQLRADLITGNSELLDQAEQEIKRAWDCCDDYQKLAWERKQEIKRLQHMQANLHGHIKRLEGVNQKVEQENAKLREALECAMQSIHQSSNPAQSADSTGSHNAHAPDAPDS